MSEVHDWMRSRLLAQAGVREPETWVQQISKKALSYESLRETEWSEKFESLMRNRLMMGALRYGLLADSKRPIFNHIESALKKLRLYLETGNQEYLVDSANYCLIEFVRGWHPNKHWGPTDDGDHCKVLHLDRPYTLQVQDVGKRVAVGSGVESQYCKSSKGPQELVYARYFPIEVSPQNQSVTGLFSTWHAEVCKDAPPCKGMITKDDPPKVARVKRFHKQYGGTLPKLKLSKKFLKENGPEGTIFYPPTTRDPHWRSKKL